MTRERSDWSTVPAFAAPDPVRLRLSRHGTALRVEWAPAEAARFAMLRLAYLPAGEAVPGRPDVLLAPARGLRGAVLRASASATRSPANCTV